MYGVYTRLRVVGELLDCNYRCGMEWRKPKVTTVLTINKNFTLNREWNKYTNSTHVFTFQRKGTATMVRFAMETGFHEVDFADGVGKKEIAELKKYLYSDGDIHIKGVYYTYAMRGLLTFQTKKYTWPSRVAILSTVPIISIAQGAWWRYRGYKKSITAAKKGTMQHPGRTVPAIAQIKYDSRLNIFRSYCITHYDCKVHRVAVYSRLCVSWEPTLTSTGYFSIPFCTGTLQYTQHFTYSVYATTLQKVFGRKNGGQRIGLTKIGLGKLWNQVW